MRNMAQRGALLFGIVFTVFAILGFMTEGGTSMESGEEQGLLLGMFPVNLVHNVVHLLFGIWGLAASRSLRATRLYGRVGASIYVVLAVLAFVDPTGFGIVPIGGNDIWLHTVLAAGLAFIGFAGAPSGDSAVIG